MSKLISILTLLCVLIALLAWLFLGHETRVAIERALLGGGVGFLLARYALRINPAKCADAAERAAMVGRQWWMVLAFAVLVSIGPWLQ